MPDPNFQDDNAGENQLDPSSNFEGRVNSSLGQDGIQNGIRNAESEAAKSSGEQVAGADAPIGGREKDIPPTNASTIPSTYDGGTASTANTYSPKKKGALTGIIVFVLGMFGVGATMFTPGLGIVQMKEVLTGNLNDQLAAMDIRSNQVFKAKLNGMSKGICTGVQIRCKFASMTQRQVDRFKKAGFIIEDSEVKDGLFGRKIITSMTAPDGTVIKNPADLTKARNSSMEVRSAMKRVFNPIYYGLSDKVANAFFEKNKTNKQKKITGNTDEERKKSLTDATSGEKADGGGVLKDKEGKSYIIDEDGGRVYDEGDTAARFAELKAEADAKGGQLGEKTKVDGKAIGGVLGGAVVGVSVLGAADSACTVYNTARAVSAAAKIARSMQLVQFAMVINSTADSIKAGDATPEEAAFVGTMLASTDAQKTVFNESTGKTEDNPFYGLSAYDSPGYKTAAYNDTPTLTMQSQQYMVGGGLSGTMDVVMSDITESIGGPQAVRDTCKFVQSPWVRGVGLAIGVFAAIGTFGVGTAISIGASVAAGFALPFLEAALADIVAGQVVNGNTAGVAAGDAAFAGTAATLGGIAQNRGLTPMSSDGLKEYMAATGESTSDMIALEKYEAADTPFDVMNQYSFLGTFARTLYPTSITAKSSIAGALTSVGSVLSKGFSSIVQPSVSAEQVYKDERFAKCNDPGYEELGIDADIFCNVRYGLTASELVMDTEVVVDFMVKYGYVNAAGVPQKEYAEFMKNCPNREDGWGETSEEGGSVGLECVDGNSSTYANISYFRVYTLDASISDAMDDEDTTTQQLSSGEYVLPVEPGYQISSPWGPRECSGCSKFHRGIDMTNYPSGSKGKPVFAIADGEVISADKSNGSGTSCAGGRAGGGNNLVQVKHANGAISGYWHMAPGDIKVSVGDQVTAGQQIGAINNCGQSYGAHLHFTIQPGDTTDPNILAVEGDSGYLNPTAFMALFGVDTNNGIYTDGR